jgi:uncharacterized protein (UPF0248 family)
MRHKHTLKKIRVNRILNKVDKEYEESTKTYRIEPIASANEEGLDSCSLESMKYWKRFNELINKGTHK